ncbi:hypothetical protein ATL17_1616 [Maritalea mobilis]|uniref:Uncharacterized protein n=1 Tax=Maritalea mobilis TaxID=483324 RepID=A0A4R6VJ37_9HYPH|nr:hypothetical protein [Maritalea mobilis]TDQ63609.1 hypothetical protein ATL17_1616 [Maritalea mobilis]
MGDSQTTSNDVSQWAIAADAKRNKDGKSSIANLTADKAKEKDNG